MGSFVIPFSILSWTVSRAKLSTTTHRLRCPLEWHKNSPLTTMILLEFQFTPVVLLVYCSNNGDTWTPTHVREAAKKTELARPGMTAINFIYAIFLNSSFFRRRRQSIRLGSAEPFQSGTGTEFPRNVKNAYTTTTTGRGHPWKYSVGRLYEKKLN